MHTYLTGYPTVQSSISIFPVREFFFSLFLSFIKTTLKYSSTVKQKKKTTNTKIACISEFESRVLHF